MPTRGRSRPGSRLRVVAGQQRRTPVSTSTPAWSNDGACAGNVLVAGADVSARGQMIEEMRRLLPDGTSFVEAGETWQVLGLAAESHMVIVTSDLRDVSAKGLVKVLGRRHPLLPVIALRGNDHRVALSDDVDIASL